VPRYYLLEETGYDPVVHNPEEDVGKIEQALVKSREWGDRIPVGIFYQNEFVPTYEDRISQRIEDYRVNPPAKQIISTDTGGSTADLKRMIEALRIA